MRLWQLVGATQIVLGLAHSFIWRAFGWTDEMKKVSPLTARVFFAHTFFIAFVLVGFGALQVLRPDLLTTPSGLTRSLLGVIVMFWGLRFLAQPFLFDPVLLPGSSLRTPMRLAAWLTFAGYTAFYAVALARMIGR